MQLAPTRDAVILKKIAASQKDLPRRGALEKIRTPGLLIRSQTLYPAELPAHKNLLKYHTTPLS